MTIARLVVEVNWDRAKKSGHAVVFSSGVQIRFSTDSVKPKMKGWNRFRRQFGVIRPVSAQKNRKFFGYRKTFSISAKPKTEIFSAKPKAENFQQKPKTENFSVMMSHFPFLANNSLSCPLSSDFHHSIKETILRIGNLEKIRNSPENFSGNKIREKHAKLRTFFTLASHMTDTGCKGLPEHVSRG